MVMHRPWCWGVLLFAVAPAAAQSVPQVPVTADYFFPDLPSQTLVYDGDYLRIKPIFAMVGDYTAFTQDEASLEQVSEQEDTTELRAGRLGLLIRAKGRVGWEVYTTVDYQERRTREKAVFQLYDLQIRIPVGPVRITVGKQKEPISYELLELSALLPQQERILLPFFPTRNIGVNIAGYVAGDRMTWAAGVFNDWLETGATFGRNATDYDGRVTALLWESREKTDYVHVGGGLRSLGSDDGVMRFSGRPESNVTDKYVDTGDFSGRRAEELALEGLWSRGPFSVLGEHFSTWVDATESGDPRFSGSYLVGSWFVTGESRPYLRAMGFAGGVTPRRRFGALEVVVRYSHLDLTDGPIDGGLLNKMHYGVNLWASTQWKVGFSYGEAGLERDALHGSTRMFLTRFQWLY